MKLKTIYIKTSRDDARVAVSLRKAAQLIILHVFRSGGVKPEPAKLNHAKLKSVFGQRSWLRSQGQKCWY